MNGHKPLHILQEEQEERAAIHALMHKEKPRTRNILERVQPVFLDVSVTESCLMNNTCCESLFKNTRQISQSVQEFKTVMEQEDTTQSLQIEAQSIAKEYVELLREWIPKRESTVQEIISIASELEDVKQGVNYAKVAGGAVAVAGGLAAMGALFLTGGLAAPILGAGIAGTLAGGATTAAAGIAEHFISKGKLQWAQTVLDADAEQARKIEAKKEELDSKARDLSSCLQLSFEQMLGALLITSISDDIFRPDNQLALFKVLTSSAILASMLKQSFGVGSVLGKGMVSTFAKVSMKGATAAVGAVLRGFAVGVLLVWDIYLLVENSFELANGSPSGAAEALREIAHELERQSNDLKDVLKRIRDETVDYGEKIKQHFRRLLEQASAQGYASDEDAQQIYDYMCLYSCTEWQDAFSSLDLDLKSFSFHLARIFCNMCSTMEKYLDENNPQRPHHLNITLIAHGRINPEEVIPCQLYYMTPFLEAVTLYSPWGCAIDASVVYGIATNTIQTENVAYSATVLPQRPLLWNDLPRDPTLTPNIIFSPVLKGEDDHQTLMELCSLSRGSADGLVIPYFSGSENDLLPFPVIPLWVCSNVVAICGHLLNVSCTLRIAGCLSPENPSAIPSHQAPAGGYLIGLNQYCQVPMNLFPPATMTSRFTGDQRISLALQRISGGLFL